MSKKPPTSTKTEQTEQTAPASAAPPAEATASATTLPASNETALASAGETALEEYHPDSLHHLVQILPHKAKRLNALRRVRSEEFESSLMKVPAAAQAAFQDLMERMNPERETRETGEPRFRPATLRLYQGVGEKPKNPKLPKGGVEDGAGNIVLVPDEFKDMFEGVPSKLVVSVIFMSNGRAFWPPRDANGQPIIPAGLDIKGNQMICGSADRVVGSRYGKCDACPYKPDFGKKEKGCKDNIDLFVVTPDLSAIYQITVGATSFKTCTSVIEAKANGWKKDYAGQFTLESQLIEKTGQSYLVWKATPVTSRAEPNGVMNSPEIQEVMALLSRQIQTEVFYPRLANNYARAGLGTGNSADAPAAGSIADVEAAAAGAGYAGGENNITV